MYPTDQENAAASSSAAIENALQVLAATASNDRLRERYLDDKSSSNSNTSPLSHDDRRIASQDEDLGGPADDKSSDVLSEDDESGSGCSGSSGSAVISKTTGLRKGKWTVEEEEYATRFIHFFSSGLLCLPEGKTLRASLAEKLQCDPMRITKKYGGASCLGNKISKLCNRPRFLAQDIEMARLEMARLERRFHLRMAQGGDVPLPPDNENDASPIGVHTVASASSHLSSTNTTIASSGAGGVQMNSGFPQLSSANASTTLPMAKSMLHSVSQPPLHIPPATTATSLPSYLATLAGNAQLAAAASSISPHAAPAPMMVGVPPQQQHQSQQAPNPLGHQQINNININNTQTISQALMAIPAVNWPMVFQSISQAGINNATADLSANNKQLVQTLLLQITSQLQALAALSPATMKQIQLQLLAATITTASQTAPQNSPPPPPPQQQAPVSAWTVPAPDTSALLSSFQLASSHQAQSGHAISGGTPSSIGLQNIAHPFVQATGPIQKNFLVGNVNSFASTSSISSSQAPLSKLVHVRQQQQQNADHGSIPVKRLRDAPSVVQREVASSNTTGSNMEEFLAKLRQRHAEAIEQARREQSSDHHHRSFSTKQTKVNNAGNSGIVTLLEHSTTESSGSGCTTNEGSTSSVENVPASDETRNDGSTSSNSSSEEDDAESGGQASSSSSHHKPSIPLRKRFRSENNDAVGGGGITRRNLADHNYRMAEEMKNQDK